MKSLIAIAVLVSEALLAQGLRKPTANEQRALEEFDAKDRVASLKGDWETLAGLWTDDGVALPPGEEPVVGIAAIRKWLEADRLDPAVASMTEYLIQVRDIAICGDTAIEWGIGKVEVRPRGATGKLRATGNVERILKRQADGSWKVQRAIWNMGIPKPVLSSPKG